MVWKEDHLWFSACFKTKNLFCEVHFSPLNEDCGAAVAVRL